MAPVSQPAGNYYDKYNTRNPVARALMQGFLRAFDELAEMVPARLGALEIGCGEGELSMRLAKAGRQVRGCDIASEAVTEARKRVAFAGLSIDIQQCDIRDARTVYALSELVVCCEVLEHLEDTQGALDILQDLTTDYLLLSVPREPLWRVLNMARGKYLGQLGNTPGHIQHWSRRSFLELLSRRYEVVAVRSPLPWTMALCRLRHA
jgi:2-polyprenyl-3-methyl-5-hydroxy-6-metoxy-1,4-benzoquinol methylase